MSHACYAQATSIKSIEDVYQYIANHQQYATEEILNYYCPTRDELMKYTQLTRTNKLN